MSTKFKFQGIPKRKQPQRRKETLVDESDREANGKDAPWEELNSSSSKQVVDPGIIGANLPNRQSLPSPTNSTSKGDRFENDQNAHKSSHVKKIPQSPRAMYDVWGEDTSTNSANSPNKSKNFGKIQSKKSFEESLGGASANNDGSLPKNGVANNTSTTFNRSDNVYLNAADSFSVPDASVAGVKNAMRTIPKTKSEKFPGPSAKLDFSSGWDLEFEVNAVGIENAILTTKKSEQNQPLEELSGYGNQTVSNSRSKELSTKAKNNLAAPKAKIPQKSALKSSNSKSSDNSFNSATSGDSSKKVTTIVEPSFDIPDLVHKSRYGAYNEDNSSQNMHVGQHSNETGEIQVAEPFSQLLTEQSAWDFEDDPTIFAEFDGTASPDFPVNGHEIVISEYGLDENHYKAATNSFAPTPEPGPTTSISPKQKMNSPKAKIIEVLPKAEVPLSSTKIISPKSKPISPQSKTSEPLPVTSSSPTKSVSPKRSTGDIFSKPSSHVVSPHQETSSKSKSGSKTTESHFSHPAELILTTAPGFHSSAIAKSISPTILPAVTRKTMDTSDFASVTQSFSKSPPVNDGYAGNLHDLTPDWNAKESETHNIRDEAHIYWNEEENRAYTQEEIKLWESGQNNDQTQYTQAEIDAWHFQQASIANGVENYEHAYVGHVQDYPPERTGLIDSNNDYLEDNAYLPEGALNQSSEYLHNAEKWDESAHGGNSAYDINGNVIDQTEYDGTDCKQSSIAQDQYDQYGNVIPLNESAPVEQEFGVDDNDNFTIGWDQNASSYQQYDESILQSNGYIENSHSEQLYEDYGNPANTNEWDQNATEPAEAMDINMTPYQPAAEFGNGQKWIPNGILEQHITDGWEQSNEELDEKSRVEQQYDEYSINAVDAQEWDKTALPNQQWINVANFEQQYDEFGNVLGTQQLEQNLSSYSNWDENLNAGSWQQDEVDGLEAVVELVCDNCRKINELDSNFCVKCGNALIRHPVVLPPPPIAPATQAKAKAQSLEPHIDAASVPHIHQGANGLRDPLQREQGHCLAIFGFGGKVITMCPKRQIMYQSDGHGGQVAMEKIYPGMIAIKRVEKYLFSYISEELRSRNPIFSNVKIKKDTLKSELNTLRSCKVATEEYLLLIDYIENLLDNDCSTKSFDIASKYLMGKLKPERIVMQTSMDEIMAKLLDGATKDACNLAVSTGHWPIALILASRISQEVYSDIVLQFAIKGVNSSANSSDWSIISLQILFAVMGGSDPVSILNSFFDINGELCNVWKEILILVLANRTPTDVNFFGAFAEILNLNGMCEQAQICYLLGIGAINSCGRFPLLGGSNSSAYLMDINSIRLTEIFEYSLISASGKSQISPLPHFQAYKLWYATYLADMGMVSHASAYVSSILAVTKALAEPCPYIHGIFGLLLKELGDRLEVMYGADCSVSNESSNSGWLGKISENFTGAALGRGLEHLMNSAVGVPSSQPKNNHAAIAPSESMNESQLNGVYLAPEGNSGNYSSMGQQSASVAQNNIYSNAAISTVGQSAPVEPYQNYTGQTYEDGVQNNIQGVYSDHLHQNYADQSYGDDAPNYTEDVYTDPPHQEYNYHTYNDNPQNYTEGAYTDNSNQDYIDRTHGNDFQSYGEEDYSGYNRNYGESPQNYLSQPLEGVSQRYSDDTYPSNSENLANQSFADSTSANPEQISPATYENNSRVLGEINPNHSTSKLPNSIPVSHIPKHPSLHGEDEDLGFGNSKKPVYAASHSEAKNSENTSSELSKENKAKDAVKPPSKGFFGSFVSVLGFGGRKDGEEGPKKAHLPSGSSFHYDPVLKKWVNKNGGAEKPKEELAPPPIIPVSTGPKTSHSTTTPTPRNNEKLHNSMPLSSLNGTKEVGSSVPDGKGKKRSARSKYVDVLNPDSAPKTPSFMPSFPGSSGSGQKPKMMMNVPIASPKLPSSPQKPQNEKRDALDRHVGPNRALKSPVSPMIQAKRMSRPSSTSNLTRSKQGAPPDL